jgi:hypothetical protein
MKKHLLLGSALFAAMSAFPQQAVLKQKAEAQNLASLLAEKFERRNNPYEPAIKAEAKAKTSGTVYGPENNPAMASRSSITLTPGWQPFTGSMNIYGMLVSSSKPLMYNDQLDVVSFIHRKSIDYEPNPTPIDDAKSGVIVGMITNNWGTEWDTTALWNSDSYWGRYPQGGTYSIPGNECLRDSAYIIAMGPVTGDNTGWTGSFIASKKLDTLGGPGNSDTVSAGFSDHMWVSNSSNFGSLGKMDFPRYDFTVTDDGVIHGLGFLANNVNGTGSAYGWQGASVIRGTYAGGGSFNWSTDTIIPDVFVNSQGSQMVTGTPHMCWNESGTVGYVWFIGVRDPRPGMGDTLSNMGYQPIIYKTTNSGATWTEMPRIDFNANNPQLNKVFRQIYGVRNDSIGIPFFNFSEGIDAIVDRNNRLHLVSTVVGTFSKHPDSLGYTYLLTHADGERYNFGHEPGLRPYIFDFTETNTGVWNVTMIDSMSSEAPGETSGTDGYNYNPWDAAGGSSGTDKVGADARIQLSRTPDGRYIVYTWAESDTGYTFQGFKWNSLPNVKARLAEVGVETGTTTPASLVVHPNEINVTSPASNTVPPYTFTNKVQDRAVMHYVSSKAAIISNTASSGVAIGLPITVSNNTFVPMKQLVDITHWYLSANLNFDMVTSVDWPTNNCVALKIEDTSTVKLPEIEQSIAGSVIFPNPAANSAQLSIGLSSSSDVEVNVTNAIGQVVRTVRHIGRAGINTISIDLNNLSTGVYMVNIKVDDAIGTKKLIIQH